MPRKGRVIAPHMTRRAGNNSRKLNGPVALETREGWAVLIALRAKAVSGMEGPLLPRGWGLNTQLRLRVVLGTSQMKSLIENLRVV